MTKERELEIREETRATIAHFIRDGGENVFKELWERLREDELSISDDEREQVARMVESGNGR